MLQQLLRGLLVFEAHMYGNPREDHHVEYEQAGEYDLPVEPGIGGIHHGGADHGHIQGSRIIQQTGVQHHQQIHILQFIQIGIGQHRRDYTLVHAVPTARVGIHYLPTRQVFDAVVGGAVYAVFTIDVVRHVVHGQGVLVGGGGVRQVEHQQVEGDRFVRERRGEAQVS